MQDWKEEIERAVDYIESHLTQKLEIADIARQAHVSSFYFQRIFATLCGVTVGAYIRSRRLTLAAQELLKPDARVIDVAMRYGYDSPDSFARAFVKFHGISPSRAKCKGVSLRTVVPLKIKTGEGGRMLAYKIIHKAQFTVMGRSRKFDPETSYIEIPKFWQEHMDSGEGKNVCGLYGICLESEGAQFEYMIADNYQPCCEVPEGYRTLVIAEHDWAVFPWKGKLPEALQDVNTQIWRDWAPALKEYRLAGDCDLEVYAPRQEHPAEDSGEIWVSVEKI